MQTPSNLGAPGREGPKIRRDFADPKNECEHTRGASMRSRMSFIFAVYIIGALHQLAEPVDAHLAKNQSAYFHPDRTNSTHRTTSDHKSTKPVHIKGVRRSPLVAFLLFIFPGLGFLYVGYGALALGVFLVYGLIWNGDTVAYIASPTSFCSTRTASNLLCKRSLEQSP